MNPNSKQIIEHQRKKLKQLLFFWFVAVGLIISLVFIVYLLPAISANEDKHQLDHEHDSNNPFREKCANCHADEIAYQEWHNSNHKHALVNLIEGKYATRDSCLGCHSAGYDKFSSGEWRTQHGKLTLETAVNSVSCSSCHLHSSKREHYLTKNPKTLCTSCHKMDCGCAGAGVIHQSQSEMFMGRLGAGVKLMPAKHAKIMKKRCIYCHMAKDDTKTIAKHGGHTFKADYSTCSRCHENMNIQIKQHKTDIQKKMAKVKMMLDSATDFESKAYKDAKLNYDMVNGDAGFGMHNPLYAQALLNYALTLEPEIIK